MMPMCVYVWLPSILLSGFVFPRAEMPLPIYWASFVLPATYFIEILRGIILRGAELTDLTSSVVGLTICQVASQVSFERVGSLDRMKAERASCTGQNVASGF